MPNNNQTVFIAKTVSSCCTLGPGKRGAIWVTGCSRRCPGCIAEPLQDRLVGRAYNVKELASQILLWKDIEGITVSGGEPFEQAGALAELCRILKEQSKLSIMSYSGFTLTELQASSDPARQQLLQYLDILIDGPFIRSLQADLLWRGSSNQQVHFLKTTYRDLASLIDGPGAGVEIHIGMDGTFSWIGIPEPGFDENLRNELNKKGIKLNETGRLWI